MSTMATIRIINVIEPFVQNMTLYFVYSGCSLIYLTLNTVQSLLRQFSRSFYFISEVGGPHVMFHF